MPCIDGREKHDDKLAHYAVAILCGVIRKNGVDVLKGLDYKTMGVSEEAALAWWYWHEHIDEFYHQKLNDVLR